MGPRARRRKKQSRPDAFCHDMKMLVAFSAPAKRRLKEGRLGIPSYDEREGREALALRGGLIHGKASPSPYPYSIPPALLFTSLQG